MHMRLSDKLRAPRTASTTAAICVQHRAHRTASTAAAICVQHRAHRTASTAAAICVQHRAHRTAAPQLRLCTAAFCVQHRAHRTAALQLRSAFSSGSLRAHPARTASTAAVFPPCAHRERVRILTCSCFLRPSSCSPWTSHVGRGDRGDLSDKPEPTSRKTFPEMGKEGKRSVYYRLVTGSVARWQWHLVVRWALTKPFHCYCGCFGPLSRPLRQAAESEHILPSLPSPAIGSCSHALADLFFQSTAPSLSSPSRMHGELLRLLFLQAHRESTAHFTAIGGRERAGLRGQCQGAGKRSCAGPPGLGASYPLPRNPLPPRSR